MKFVDQAEIYVHAGDGGNGCVAFRREKYVPFGGPSGGNGGNGGNIILQADPGIGTLIDLKYKPQYRAKRGEHGLGSDKHGKSAPALIIRVPVGTLVRDKEAGEQIVDLKDPGQEVVIAEGGRGGRGNASFATSTNRAPRRAEEGAPGRERWLRLDLKLLADVGLIGYPNVGKSTLLSRISAAHPKIADYPFTTLTPQLGVVRAADFQNFVVADLPGLIEGAHQGVGLGDRFLKHIERTRLLVHLVDISQAAEGDPVDHIMAINNELESFHYSLMQKPQILVATKLDAWNEEKWKIINAYANKTKTPLVGISSVTGKGLKSLIHLIWEELKQLKTPPA
jgi:GTP-binding protein